MYFFRCVPPSVARCGQEETRTWCLMLVNDFTEAEARTLAIEMERKWKGLHPLPEGAGPEFAASCLVRPAP